MVFKRADPVGLSFLLSAVNGGDEMCSYVTMTFNDLYQPRVGGIQEGHLAVRTWCRIPLI